MKKFDAEHFDEHKKRREEHKSTRKVLSSVENATHGHDDRGNPIY